jgi:hypothetical protein
MFWNRGAILRESSRTQEYKSDMLIWVLNALTGIIKILKFLS